MGESLRLLQAGDVNLDVPLYGIGDLPDGLQRHLANARYESFRSLIDAAIHRRVDAIVLAGNLLPVRLPGSPARWFLHEQFSRLTAHAITVLVRGDALPTPPAGLAWPENVVPTAARHAVRWMTRSQQTVRVSDGLHPYDLSGVADHQLVVGGQLPTQQRIDHSPGTFWACSDDSAVTAGSSNLDRAHRCGPLQGSGFEDCGPHGAWELAIERGQYRDLRLVACDAVHWQQEELLLDSSSTRTTVLTEMVNRATQLHKRAGTTTVVRWLLSGEGELLNTFWSPRVRQDLLDEARKRCPTGCSMAGLEVATAAQQRDDLQESSLVSAFRHTLSTLTQSETIDFLLIGDFDSQSIPSGCRMLSRQRYLDHLEPRIDERLRGDLLPTARSA